MDDRTAEKFALLVFDFEMTYSKIDHRMLQLELLRKKLPKYLVTWVHHFLRDQTACREVNGVCSIEWIFWAGQI